MTELHSAFTTWLAAGGRDTLPRDIALHASACPDCLSAAAAHDALGAVDPGAASLPPELPPSSLRRARALGMARVASGLAAVALIAAAGFVAANGILRGGSGPLSGARPTPRGEGVLGGLAGPASATPSPTPRPSASESATESASASATATATAIPQVGAPNPPMGGGPTLIATPWPTPLPPPATTPTPIPVTPPPAATPTPVPVTPSPTPSALQSASSAPSASASGP